MKTLVFTGGHHTSALAAAETLKHRGWRIVWFGHRHSLWNDSADSAEYQEVTSAGIPFYDLLAGKFYRTLNPLKLIRIPYGFLQSFYLLLRLRLELKSDLKGIVSFGGYLAVPTVVMGWALGIPSITHEQTVVAGWANRIVTLFAKKIALAWPNSLGHFPASKVVVTGLPLRPDFPKKRHLHKPVGLPAVYITGGKQGSHILNQVVFSSLPQLTEKYQLIHQTGSTALTDDFAVALSLAKKYPGRYQVFGFDSRLAMAALARCQAVVSRSGAHTVYELALLGLPCVLVPISWSSHNEQYQNAKILSDAGQAVIITQSQLSPASLLTALSAVTKLTPHPLPVPANGLQRVVQLIESTFI